MSEINTGLVLAVVTLVAVVLGLMTGWVTHRKVCAQTHMLGHALSNQAALAYMIKPEPAKPEPAKFSARVEKSAMIGSSGIGGIVDLRNESVMRSDADGKKSLASYSSSISDLNDRVSIPLINNRMQMRAGL